MTNFPQEVAAKMNDQVTHEIEASLIYLQLSYQLAEMGLTGMSKWMRHHADEEMEHAERFSTHLLDRGVVPQIGAISLGEFKVVRAVDAFKLALEHEKKVSAQIREIARVADEANDYDARPIVNWFLDEQIEEEATIGEIVDRLLIAGDDGAGLLRIDAELASGEAES